MNLYLMSREGETGYDEFEGFVVAAISPEKARCVHPREHLADQDWMDNPDSRFRDIWFTFNERENIKCKFLGKTKLKAGVVLASFNAG